MNQRGYERARPGTIKWEVEGELLARFGDGRPFRWRDVRDAYKRAWKRVKGNGRNEIPYEPTLGVSRFLERTDWIIWHQDSRPDYSHSRFNGQFYYHKGIWHSIVGEDELMNCRRLNETEQVERPDVVYYYDEPGSPKCAVCRMIHTNPINVRKIGRYEVF